jgi:hypothetical protein
MPRPRESAEGEVKGLRAGIQKLNLELAIGDRFRLANELVEPLPDNRAAALAVNVRSVSGARGLSVEEHTKSYGGSSRRGSHDEIEVARVEAVCDSSRGLVQRNGLLANGPIAGERPLVEVLPCGKCVDVRLVPRGAARRGEAFGLPIAGVGLRGSEVAPFGGDFSATEIDRNRLAGEVGAASLDEQQPANLLRLGRQVWPPSPPGHLQGRLVESILQPHINDIQSQHSHQCVEQTANRPRRLRARPHGGKSEHYRAKSGQSWQGPGERIFRGKRRSWC